MNKPIGLCLEEGRHLIDDPKSFPFKTVLSLGPLVEYWRSRAGRKCPFQSALWEQIEAGLAGAPELLEPIADPSRLTPHRNLLSLMMSAVIPPASWDHAYMAAVAPFTYETFYSTAAYDRVAPTVDRVPKASIDECSMAYLRTLYAYSLILHREYGIESDFNYPIVRSTVDPDTGLVVYCQATVDPQFIEVCRVRDLDPLSTEDRKRLIDNLTDLRVLRELIPPDAFEFRGFAVVQALDVTDQQVLSSVKHSLIEKGSIVSPSQFLALQDRLRELFGRENLALSLAALRGDEVWVLNSGLEMKQHCICHDSAHYPRSAFSGSIVERALVEGRPLVIDDLTRVPDRSEFENKCLGEGARNMLVAPLMEGAEAIGVLVLSSRDPGTLNPMNSMKILEVSPLFAVAVKRSLDEVENTVQAIIKEKCTAIHPTVEWRFREAAIRYAGGMVDGGHPEFEEIVFPGVHPLFAVSDIRNSSTLRNDAIREDLRHQLESARRIVSGAKALRPLPILDEMEFRLERHLESIDGELMADDEMGVVDFLRRETEPFFEELLRFGPDIEGYVREYRDQLEPELKVHYRRRREFDGSVARINDTLAACLDAEQAKAQEMFPHFFEKHVTDGVDHSIYVGESLTRSRRYDPIYLRNLRLWQLLVVSRMASAAERIKEDLPVRLETAHLIAVQSMPLTIRFRNDEKQFNVDGSYNIRYEILKKRIDKATIKGRRERLTQPGQIAIVYSQPREAEEYAEYIEFLQSTGHLTGDLERFELDDLQGIHGLKAMRVGVNLAHSSQDRPAMDVAAVMTAAA